MFSKLVCESCGRVCKSGECPVRAPNPQHPLPRKYKECPGCQGIVVSRVTWIGWLAALAWLVLMMQIVAWMVGRSHHTAPIPYEEVARPEARVEEVDWSTIIAVETLTPEQEAELDSRVEKWAKAGIKKRSPVHPYGYVFQVTRDDKEKVFGYLYENNPDRWLGTGHFWLDANGFTPVTQNQDDEIVMDNIEPVYVRFQMDAQGVKPAGFGKPTVIENPRPVKAKPLKKDPKYLASRNADESQKRKEAEAQKKSGQRK